VHCAVWLARATAGAGEARATQAAKGAPNSLADPRADRKTESISGLECQDIERRLQTIPTILWTDTPCNALQKNIFASVPPRSAMSQNAEAR
jgi:ABC-type iron transport system FetAB ATPase subunit